MSPNRISDGRRPSVSPARSYSFQHPGARCALVCQCVTTRILQLIGVACAVHLSINCRRMRHAFPDYTGRGATQNLFVAVASGTAFQKAPDTWAFPLYLYRILITSKSYSDDDNKRNNVVAGIALKNNTGAVQGTATLEGASGSLWTDSAMWAKSGRGASVSLAILLSALPIVSDTKRPPRGGQKACVT